MFEVFPNFIYDQKHSPTKTFPERSAGPFGSTWLIHIPSDRCVI